MLKGHGMFAGGDGIVVTYFLTGVVALFAETLFLPIYALALESQSARWVELRMRFQRQPASVHLLHHLHHVSLPGARAVWAKDFDATLP